MQRETNKVSTVGIAVIFNALRITLLSRRQDGV